MSVMASLASRPQSRDPSRAIDGLLCASNAGSVRTSPRSANAATASRDEVVQLLRTLSAQQDAILQSQKKFSSQIEEKEAGFRRWTEFLITQKEGELWMQLEQHHLEMMSTLTSFQNKPKKDARQRLDILQRHHLLTDKDKGGGRGGPPPLPAGDQQVLPLAVGVDMRAPEAPDVQPKAPHLEEQPEIPMSNRISYSSQDGLPLCNRRFSKKSTGSEVAFGRQKKQQRVIAERLLDWNGFDLPKTWPSQKDFTLKKNKSSRSAGSETYSVGSSPRESSLISRLVTHSGFDILMSLIIVANVGTMYAEQEMRSDWRTAYKLGLRSDDGNWDAAKDLFDIFEVMFCVVYIVELLLRLYVYRLHYLRETINIFDMAVVVLTSVDTFVASASGGSDSADFALARLVRLARVFRAAKVLRLAQGLSELRVLIRTLTASFRALCLSILLLTFIICSGGILISQALTSFMENDRQPYAERVWAFDHFGSASKASRRMFDATFTYAWVADSRRMTDNINRYFLIFWILWTLMINFTVMRVIGALFLKQTLDIANEDRDKMELQRMEKKQTYAETVRSVFRQADTSGDGMVSTEEFKAFICNPQVAEIFTKLDLELFEVVALFRLLVDDRGEADYEEFLQGALKLKTTASTIDAIQILHASRVIEDQIEGLAEILVGEIVFDGGAKF